jgi:hypothetical protein
MSDPTPEFDDPHLKATLRRALGGATADAGLQAAMAELVSRETRGGGGGPAALPLFKRPVVRWVAAAAVLLIVAGGGGVLWQRHLHEVEEAQSLAANLPLFHAMIDAQQSAGASGEQPLTATLDDRDALRNALSARLGRPVPAPDWRDKGWRLASAAVGRVGAHSAALLRYENGGRRILVVSLPAGAFVNHEDEEPHPYTYAVKGHTIVGFVKDGGLHCAVGDLSVAARELEQLKID